MLYNKYKSSSGEDKTSENSGRFITFEGIDGSGKSTQIAMLEQALHRANIPVKTLREPGGTKIGEAIRRVILDPQHAAMHLETELLLFAAARAQLVREVIRPSLKAGIWILCDRFADSSVAYQGYGRGLDINMIEAINDMATKQHRPDKTILLDIPVKLALDRRQARGTGSDRIDQENLDFMRRTRDGYRQMAKKEPDRFILVDAERPKDPLAQKIYSEIREGFGI